MSIFDTIQIKKPKSNVFDLSHDFKYSMDMGRVVPVMQMSCVPGDKIAVEVQNMVRMAPMLAPIMHQVDVYTHCFFVPNRLVWPGWEDFIAPKNEDSVPPAFPTMVVNGLEEGSVGDYMGLPTGVNCGNVSAIPAAAYHRIWHEFYRDQNVAPYDTPINLVSGDNPAASFIAIGKPLLRAWQHDYFTSALPWPQKGPAVTLPLGDFTDVPVVIPPGGLELYAGGPNWDSDDNYLSVGGTGGTFNVQAKAEGVQHNVTNSNMTAKTSELEAEAVTMNSLRRAEALQKWFEKMARGGTRYIEVIKAHFGVNSSDKRMQRPEYIYGSKAKVIISEVLQTSETADETPQGNMAGHGLSLGGSRGKEYFCEEHGTYFVLVSVMPKPAYQQGIQREWLKTDRTEFFWPDFANIGEQEVFNKELYVGDDGHNDDVFGYVPRYSEYKYSAPRVAGAFRSSLDFWHMGRKFATRPNLSADFIYSPPTKRIFAVVDENQHSLWCHSFFKIRANRRMPVYGTPTL